MPQVDGWPLMAAVHGEVSIPPTSHFYREIGGF